MPKTISFADFMNESYKVKGLTNKEKETFDTACVLLGICLVGLLVVGL